MTFSTVTLRDYQERAIAQLAPSLARSRKTILQLPTGSGKTRVATAIIQRAIAKGNRVLFIVDREELVEQTCRALDAAGVDYGCMHSFNTWGLDAPVVVATAQTLARREWPFTELVIVDECHTMYTDTLTKMVESENQHFIGLTATPFSKGLGKFWKGLVVGATTRELIDAGYLCEYHVFGPPPADLSQVKTVAGDYHQGQLAQAVNRKQIVGDVVKTWLSLGENRQTICFGVDVAHSKRIVEEFTAYGVPAAHIDAYSDSEERREALSLFRSGAVKVISSVDILTKGFDHPEASCLIMARPTKSLTVYIQQAGRVLRTAEGKANAIILDHGGNTEFHGFPCDPLPSFLCDGTRKQSTGQKKERQPKACQKCHYVKPAGVHECPSCGFAPERQTEVEGTDDHLVRKEKLKNPVKQEWYAMLLHHAREKGFKDGWAAHKFKEKFGVWPHRNDVVPVEPNDEVRGYIKHLQIRQAKSKRKPVKSSCKYCGSTNLYRAEGKGPHSAQLRCGGCQRHVQWLPKGEAA
jgi:superfamily II DNA or RNA helicase